MLQMINHMKIIGENIKNLRKKANYSQESLSLKAGISITNLRNIENGTSNPTVQTLSLISKVLNVSFVEIICPHNKEMEYIYYFYNLMTTLPPNDIEAITSMIKAIVDIILAHEKREKKE